MPSKLRDHWEKHGELQILVDRHGWKRAMVWREEHTGVYAAGLFGLQVWEIGTSCWRTKRDLMRLMMRKLKEWYAK